MKSSEPSIGAKWILEHIEFGHANDALIGDLQEAFKTQERSQWWYWRQALIAILVAFSNELRRHWLMACRAAAFGLSVSYGAQMLGHEALINLHHSLTSVIGVHAFRFPDHGNRNFESVAHSFGSQSSSTGSGHARKTALLETERILSSRIEFAPHCFSAVVIKFHHGMQLGNLI